MVVNHGLMRIFWPSDAPSSSNPGVIVGWRNSDLDVLVVAILQDVEVGIRFSHACALLTLSRHEVWKMPFESAHSSGTVPIPFTAYSKDAESLPCRF